MPKCVYSNNYTIREGNTSRDVSFAPGVTFNNESPVTFRILGVATKTSWTSRRSYWLMHRVGGPELAFKRVGLHAGLLFLFFRVFTFVFSLKAFSLRFSSRIYDFRALRVLHCCWFHRSWSQLRSWNCPTAFLVLPSGKIELSQLWRFAYLSYSSLLATRW